MTSIAACINVYQDAVALRRLLEMSQSFFDNIYVIHSGPNNAKSTDGTLDVLHQFGIHPVFADINDGFGVIRSRLIHECGCDWGMILDSDEAFYPLINKLTCVGTENWKLDSKIPPNLTVTKHPEIINQGQILKDLIKEPSLMAIRTTRRHWLDFSFKYPSQNWHHNRDWQLRCWRNVKEIHYKTNVKMHEQITDDRTGREPVFASPDNLHHDHFHCFYRNNFPDSKQWNERNYQRLEKNEKMENH